MIFGQYSPCIFFRISSVVIGITILLIYLINQHLHHDKPFPYTYISQVAHHYPQYVFFRIATISGSVLIVLGWFVNYFYIKTICYQNVVNIHKYHPQIVLILGIMGGFLLMGSTANIDTGKMNTDWHVTCASYFFFVTMTAQLLNTALYMKLTFINKIANKYLTYLKMLQSLIVIYQLYLNTLNIYSTQQQQQINKVSGVLLEWVSAYTILLGYFISSFDVKNFKFIYQKISMKQNNLSMNLIENNKNNNNSNEI